MSLGVKDPETVPPLLRTGLTDALLPTPVTKGSTSVLGDRESSQNVPDPPLTPGMDARDVSLRSKRKLGTRFPRGT